MSALLVKAVAAGRVRVRKNRKISGEVAIHFFDGQDSIRVSSSEIVDLTAKTGVTGDTLARSNLRKLLSLGHLEIVPDV